MDYQQFTEIFIREIEKRVSNYIGKECSVNQQRIYQINRSFDTLQIHPEYSTTSSFLHLEPYYNALCSGTPMHLAVSSALETIKESIRNAPIVNLSKLTQYVQIKGMLSVELISAKRNAQVLKNVPHRIIEDMAVVYQINLRIEPGQSGTILISNDLFKKYDVTLEQLHADAIHNAAIMNPVAVMSMQQLRFKLQKQDILATPEFEDEELYVTIVPNKNHGASVLLYENFLDDTAKLLGGDFFILPASRHELFLVKKKTDVHLDWIKEFMYDITHFCTDREDQLTDNVYHYDSKNRIFELADKFEARQTNNAKGC